MIVSENKILGVDDLLGRYFVDGQQESSGTFTLDPKKALERLAQFQLPGQYHWILKVIQSLHLSGAKMVKVEAGVNKVVVLSDVVPSGFDAMDDLLTQLLSDADKSDLALRHLAAGLQGSLAVQPSQIQLYTTTDGEKREYVLKSGGWRDGERVPAVGRPDSFELRLTRNLSEKLGHSWFLLNTDIFDLLFGRRGSLDKENKIIYELCDYTQCEVLLGSRPATERRFGRPRFKGYEIRQDPDPGNARPTGLKSWFSDTELVDKVAAVQHHLAELVVPAPKPGGFHLEDVSHATVTNRTDPTIAAECEKHGLVRAYAIRMQLDSSAVIYFWEDGIILGRQTMSGACPGLVALVDAKDLGKDLTTLQVLDDERLQKLLEEVKLVGEELRQQIAQNLHLMPARDLIARRLEL